VQISFFVMTLQSDAPQHDVPGTQSMLPRATAPVMSEKASMEPTSNRFAIALRCMATLHCGGFGTGRRRGRLAARFSFVQSLTRAMKVSIAMRGRNCGIFCARVTLLLAA
jgi:hypothetical protein